MAPGTWRARLAVAAVATIGTGGGLAVASDVTSSSPSPARTASAPPVGGAAGGPSPGTVEDVAQEAPGPAEAAAPTPTPEPSPEAARPASPPTASAGSRAERRRAAPVSRDGAAARREAAEPAWLRACADTVATDGFENGLLPDEALCALPVEGESLEASAARDYHRLATAYEAELGEELCITDSYRSLAAQQSLRASKPTLAAVPGTSNHGWGSALDLCGGAEVFGTREHEWLSENAPALGWVNPSWAQRGGSMPEPWHWEHVGA